MLHPQLRQRLGGRTHFAYSEKHKGMYSTPVFSQRRAPSTFQPKSLQKHLAPWPWKPVPSSNLPETTRFITKSCGASRIPNSGLLLPSLRATWQEEESSSSTHSSQGPQYPSFPASQSQSLACCPPPWEMGPRDFSQGQENAWPATEQGRGRCQLTHPLPQAP